MIRRRITPPPAQLRSYAERHAFLLGALTGSRDAALSQARLYRDIGRKDLASMRVSVARVAHHCYLGAMRTERLVSDTLRRVA